jgi:hypothetical protein
MAFVTSDPPATTQVSLPTSPVAALRIEPPRSWLELRLREVWMYHELLYFMIWRDLRMRYKQTMNRNGVGGAGAHNEHGRVYFLALRCEDCDSRFSALRCATGAHPFNFSMRGTGP